MSEEEWYGDPDYMPDMVNEIPDCDYGISEFCEDPMSRYTGCTVNCWLYQQAAEETTRVYNAIRRWTILKGIARGCVIGGFPGVILFNNRVMLYWVASFSVLLAVASYKIRRLKGL